MNNEQQQDSWRDSTNPTSGAIAVISAASATPEPAADSRRWSWPWLRHLASQLVKFGLVGGLGIVVDLGMYTLLRTTVLSSEVHEAGPMIAKILATLVAIAWNWVGNRFWTFRNARSSGYAAREGVEFFGVSLGGMIIQLVPLWIIHYGLGVESLLVENVANLFGIALGSVFRFALYRWWVYSPRRVYRRSAERRERVQAARPAAEQGVGA